MANLPTQADLLHYQAVTEARQTGNSLASGDNGTWWSSTADDGLNAWMRAMTNYGTLDVRVISR